MNRRRILLAAALSCAAGLALVDLTCAKPDSGPPGVTNNRCPSGNDLCSGVCVDVSADALNCGACGHACQSTEICSGGACQCTSGFMSCNGSCIDISSDPQHCGSCTKTCSGATPFCSHASCTSNCTGGQTACGNACVDLQTNLLNCGSCGMACPAGRSCSGGQCGCPVGQMLCSGSCVDTSVNASNCGGCGTVCSSTQLCSAGVCQCGGATPMTCPDQKTCVANASQCPGNTGTGGAAGGGGGGGAGGSGSVRPAGCTPTATMIADFEDNTDTNIVQGGRQGWWFTFADALGGSVMPLPNQVAPIPVTALPTGDPAIGNCNKYAYHSTAANRMGTNTSAYVGVGSTMNQVIPAPAAGAKTKNPYDVSAYKGISFSIKSGTASPPPIWFEVVNTETAGTPDGTATQASIDLYNTRGKLISNITTNWQTITVPFGLFGPRYLPAGSTCNGAFCEAPAFNPKSMLGLQFSMYPQFTSSTAYDLWIDNVQFVTDDSGLATFAASSGTAKPFPRDGTVGSCAKPTGAAGKFLVDAYLRWKSTFVTGTGSNTRVQRPENANDTVSEGIGYGMLIAAMMGDKTLFDGLYGFWTGHNVGGGNNMLMTWCIPVNGAGGTGSACNPNGGGSATDADEDAAYALLLAAKQWGGNYLSQATMMIPQIWTGDIDANALLPKGGTNYTDVSSRPTNPSYFAPAYYRIFGTIDMAAGHNWTGVADKVYTPLNSTNVNKGGLVPAWCASSCTGPGSNGAADDGIYQYDSHRIPWRIGLDACWNNNANAKAFLMTNTMFFVGKANAGLGSVVDIYTLGGAANSDAQPNSMSAVGSAGVGAMANPSSANTDFLNRAYRFILDANYTFDPAARTKSYTYFNGSVGLMTALTMSGNFPDYRNF